MAKQKVCLALDNLNSLTDISNRVKELSPYIEYFKIGLGAFTSFGPSIIDIIKAEQGKIFLDLKFFDIPHTVKEASLKIAKLGIDIFTVHTLGGEQMMEAALEGAFQGASLAGYTTPKVIGVTLLTSINAQQSKQIFATTIDQQDYINHLAQQAFAANLDGIVCSAQDLPHIYQYIPKEFMSVTPGITGTNLQHGADQQRISSAQEAIQNGSHLLVIGRAISSFPSRQERIDETQKILRTIEKYI